MGRSSRSAVLLAAVKQPVDGALLIDLAVAGKEILQEIVADDLTGGCPFVPQRFGDKVQIFLQRVRAVDRTQPLARKSSTAFSSASTVSRTS